MAGQTVEVSLGNPGPSATFQIPADVVPFVDSIYAEIDNTAGSDTTPTLEIRGPNGDTVAAVPQDDVVPGGDTGRATWALRLPGKRGGSAGTSSLPAAFVNTNSTVTLNTWTVNTYTAISWDALRTNDASTFQLPGSGGNTTVAHLTGGLYAAVFIPSFSGFNFPVGPGLFIYTIVGSGGTRSSTEFSINHTNAAWAEGNTNATGHDAPYNTNLFNFANPGDILVDTAWTGAGSITFTPRMYLYRIGDHLA